MKINGKQEEKKIFLQSIETILPGPKLLHEIVLI